jgi:hypothetical protein
MYPKKESRNYHNRKLKIEILASFLSLKKESTTIGQYNKGNEMAERHGQQKIRGKEITTKGNTIKVSVTILEKLKKAV